MPTLLDQSTAYASAISGIVVAVVAGAAGYFTAGWRVREVRVAYEQKIRDSYLENARKVAKEVYIPLAVAISNLNRSYSKFRIDIDFYGSATPGVSIAKFKEDCSEFAKSVDDLLTRGASAYLTLPLEE